MSAYWMSDCHIVRSPPRNPQKYILAYRFKKQLCDPQVALVVSDRDAKQDVRPFWFASAAVWVWKL